MSNPSIDRREVLAAGAVAAALSSIPARAQNQAKVVVVGAGLSGLQTALLLQEQGIDVQVIETRRRVGGRVLSLKHIRGNPEAGAETMGAGYARLRDAAERYGAAYRPNGQSYLRNLEVVIDDKLVPMDKWPDHPANVLPSESKTMTPWRYYARFMQDHVPLPTPYDWLDPKFAHLDISFDAWMRGQGVPSEVIDLCCNHRWEYNNSTHDVSALVVMFEYLWGRSVFVDNGVQSSFIFKGGNQRLPEAMASHLKREIHFGREVVAMRSTTSGAEAHCSDGTVYRADRIVSSIPFPVLRRITVDPPFQGAQREAIWTIPRQMVVEVHLVPKAKYWEADGHQPGMGLVYSPVSLLMPNGGGDDPQEVTSLTAMMLGNKAERADQVDEADVKAMVLATIEKIRPAAKGKLEVAGYKSWFRDPFASGDWTNLGPGQVTRFAEKMNAPHERIHICGDATALAARGMEAAMESAERVAVEVLSVL